jgi:hypothetical protein
VSRLLQGIVKIKKTEVDSSIKELRWMRWLKGPCPKNYK